MVDMFCFLQCWRIPTDVALILGTWIKIQNVLWQLDLLMVLAVHLRHGHYVKALVPLRIGVIGIEHCFPHNVAWRITFLCFFWGNSENVI